MTEENKLKSLAISRVVDKCRNVEEDLIIAETIVDDVIMRRYELLDIMAPHIDAIKNIDPNDLLHNDKLAGNVTKIIASVSKLQSDVATDAHRAVKSKAMVKMVDNNVDTNTIMQSFIRQIATSGVPSIEPIDLDNVGKDIQNTYPDIIINDSELEESTIG